MNKNPYAPKVPCHRVINSNGNIGGFAIDSNGRQSAYPKNLNSGVKIALLKKEGISVEKGKVKDYKKFLYQFK